MSHLHHDAQVFDVVLLGLNQLVQNKPEENKQRTVTSAEEMLSLSLVLLVAM